jgi:hypothetical protein
MGQRFSAAVGSTALWCGLFADPKDLATVVGDVALKATTKVRLIGVALPRPEASRVSAAEDEHRTIQEGFSSLISQALAPPPTAVPLGWDVVTFLPGVGFDESWRTVTGAEHLRAAHQAALDHNGLFRDLVVARRVAQKLEASHLEPGVPVPVQLYEIANPQRLDVPTRNARNT